MARLIDLTRPPTAPSRLGVDGEAQAVRVVGGGGGVVCAFGFGRPAGSAWSVGWVGDVVRRVGFGWAVGVGGVGDVVCVFGVGWSVGSVWSVGCVAGVERVVGVGWVGGVMGVGWSVGVG